MACCFPSLRDSRICQHHHHYHRRPSAAAHSVTPDVWSSQFICPLHTTTPTAVYLSAAHHQACVWRYVCVCVCPAAPPQTPRTHRLVRVGRHVLALFEQLGKQLVQPAAGHTGHGHGRVSASHDCQTAQVGHTRVQSCCGAAAAHPQHVLPLKAEPAPHHNIPPLTTNSPVCGRPAARRHDDGRQRCAGRCEHTGSTWQQGRAGSGRDSSLPEPLSAGTIRGCTGPCLRQQCGQRWPPPSPPSVRPDTHSWCP